MTNRTRRITVEAPQLDSYVVDGLRWAQQYGQSPVDAQVEAEWAAERSERPTLTDIPVVR